MFYGIKSENEKHSTSYIVIKLLYINAKIIDILVKEKKNNLVIFNTVRKIL